MKTIPLVFAILIILLALAIIVLIMKQEGNEQGLGAISGGSSESFFGRNKGKTNEARMGFITKVLVSVFCIVVLAAVLVMLFI